MGLEHAIRVGIDADGGFLTRAHVGHVGLAEVGLDPDLVTGQQGKSRRSTVHMVAHLQIINLGHDAILRRIHRGVREV
ncbi:hypothetical protein D3C80_2104990 [compost metagenome]